MAKLAVVTGASAGIGRETAIALAAADIDVVAIARNAEALADLARTHSRIEPVTADITSPGAMQRVEEAVGDRQVSALVHGAGVFPRRRITSLRPQDWRAAMETNVLARLELTLALRARLRGGRVLFIGSDAATTARPGGAAYSVTKAASAMLWRCLQAELGDEIAFAMAKPGLVATAMLDQSLQAPRSDFPAGAVYEAMKERGEVVAPATVAKFFRFLLLEVDAEEFARDAWDIRDPSHQPRWLTGALFASIA